MLMQSGIRKKVFTIKNFSNKNLEGFTLLETLFAIFVISVGLVGGLSAILQVLKSSSYLSSKLTAAYLAQEGIEIVRNIRDSNWLEVSNAWDEGLDGCSTGCEIDYTDLVEEDPVFSAYADKKLRIDPVNGFYNYDSGGETNFRRKITITEPGTAECPLDDCLAIIVDVKWSNNYTFSVQENLYNWCQ